MAETILNKTPLIFYFFIFSALFFKALWKSKTPVKSPFTEGWEMRESRKREKVGRKNGKVVRREEMGK
jgi:leucyl-tRNA synthetase